MLATYIKALESRAAWAQWAEEYPALVKRKHGRQAPNYDAVMRMYRDSLLHGDTFYMNKEFCSLVDHARETVPTDLVFEENWIHVPAGFMWLETPFLVPKPVGFGDEYEAIVKPTLRAVSWFPHVDGGYIFLTYMDWKAVFSDANGFGCWTHFSLREGDVLSERLKRFESIADDLDQPGVGKYVEGDTTNKLHEIRWIFTAMHLMAQRLAMTVEHRTSPMARESARRKKLVIDPLLKVVTLRRMEADRPPGGEHQHRDWQWKWIVEGHWRNQWYESESLHRRIFIESYVKGPDNKPLKLPGHTLFKVQR